MNDTIYLINPSSICIDYCGADIIARSGLDPALMMADSTIPTVASMASPYLRVQLCDDNITRADLEHPARILPPTEIGR